jgi:hypothetical protein
MVCGQPFSEIQELTVMLPGAKIVTIPSNLCAEHARMIGRANLLRSLTLVVMFLAAGLLLLSFVVIGALVLSPETAAITRKVIIVPLVLVIVAAGFLRQFVSNPIAPKCDREASSISVIVVDNVSQRFVQALESFRNKQEQVGG